MRTSTRVYNLFMAAFLCASIFLHFNSAFLFTPMLKLTAIVLLGGVVVGVRYSTKVPLILLGLSIIAIFFGYHSYSTRNQLFEAVVLATTCILFISNARQGKALPTSGPIAFFLGLYCLLSFFSLLLLPVDYIVASLFYHGWDSFSASVLNDRPFSVFYPLAGVARLFLFAAFAVELARFSDRLAYHRAFLGLTLGLILSMLLGFLAYFNIIIPFWLPNGWELLPNRPSFTFGNPGWFAEYATVTIPFVLLGFRQKNKFLRIGVFLVLVLTEISLILTMSRAGWMTYPVVLFSSWLVFYMYRSNSEQVIPKDFFKLVVKVAVSIPLTLIISIGFLVVLDHVKEARMASTSNAQLAKMNDAQTPGVNNSAGVSAAAEAAAGGESYSKMLADRATDTKSARYQLWRTGLAMAMESPLIGLGYETFRWHMPIMEKIPSSNFNRSLHEPLEVQDEPHNFYICILLNGGIIGLLLWMSLTVYSFVVLLRSFLRNNDFLALCAALSLYSFHAYGFFQGMQYISSIFIVGFMCFSYALMLDQGASSLLSHKTMRKIHLLGSVMACFVIALYFIFSNATVLRNKYNLASYGTNSEDYRYLGFYPQEGEGTSAFRWSGKHGVIPVDSPGLYRISYRCDDPEIVRNPVEVKLWAGTEVVEDLHLISTGIVTKDYYLPMRSGNGKLTLSVSRAWSPRSLGVSMDHRQLGIGIKLDRLLPQEIASQDGYIGFYALEKWPTPTWALQSDTSIPVRWSGASGTINLADMSKTGCTLHIFCAHPDIKNKPVVVNISGLATSRKEFVFREHGWQKLVLLPDDLADVTYVGIYLDRTWNPKVQGISEDSRDLGVAIHIR